MTSSIPSPALLVPLLTGLLGLTLLILGYRGRRLGTHPHCRRCEFDLFGLPATAANCPECGHNLRLPRAQPIGKRTRSLRLLTLGALTVLVAATWLAFGYHSRYKYTNWNIYKPIVWLRWEALGAPSMRRQAAREEIRKRIHDGRWQGDALRKYVDHVLDIQKDERRTWNPFLGDIIEAASAAKQLTDAQCLQYLKEGHRPWTLQPRPRVRLGDPIPFRMRCLTGRLGSLGPSDMKYLSTEIQLRSLTPPGSAGDGSDVRFHHFKESQFYPRETQIPPSDYLDRLTPGRYALTACYQVKCRLGRNSVYHGPTWIGEVQALAELELLPPDQPSARLVKNDALAPVIAAGIRAYWRPDYQGGGLDGQITILGDLPAHVVFDAFVLIDGQEVFLSRLIKKAEYGGTGFGVQYHKPYRGKSVDVLLRPALGGIIDSVDMTECWDGTIAIPGVPVHTEWNAYPDWKDSGQAFVVTAPPPAPHTTPP